MMLALPVEGWAHSQVCYRHLIRPVVAFVRDNGPLAVDRVCEFISKNAPGDLTFASPLHDRADAARLALNLLADDIDVVTVVDGVVSVPADTLTVNSTLFGCREIPTADDAEIAREASRRQRTLREWVHKRPFATVWRHGIRRHSEADVDWMTLQIQQFGFHGKIVVDADLGTIIDGGLRAAALANLGMALDDHSVKIRFENDRHRLAYVLAVHTMPGKNRVPIALRDAILTEILPRKVRGGEGLLRDKHGKPVEPTMADWLAITGNDFDDVEPEPEPEADPVASTVVDLTVAPDGALKDQIDAVIEADEWVVYADVITRLAALGIHSERISRTMREMARDDGRLERRDRGRHTEFRRRTITLTAVGTPFRPRISGTDKPGREITGGARAGAAQRLAAASRMGTTEPRTLLEDAKADHVLRRMMWFTFDGTAYLTLPDTLTRKWKRMGARQLTTEEVVDLRDAYDEKGTALHELYEAMWAADRRSRPAGETG